MSDTNRPFLASILSFATRAALSAFDVSALKTGQIAFVTENVGDVNAPDDADFPYYVYVPDSTAVIAGASPLGTQNSQAGVYPGRWLQLPWTFTIVAP